MSFVAAATELAARGCAATLQAAQIARGEVHAIEVTKPRNAIREFSPKTLNPSSAAERWDLVFDAEADVRKVEDDQIVRGIQRLEGPQPDSMTAPKREEEERAWKATPQQV